MADPLGGKGKRHGRVVPVLYLQFVEVDGPGIQAGTGARFQTADVDAEGFQLLAEPCGVIGPHRDIARTRVGKLMVGNREEI